MAQQHDGDEKRNAMTYQMGVDLGTAYTAASMVREGQVRVAQLTDTSQMQPSVASIREDGTILAGAVAARRAISHPDRTIREYKRRFGDPAPIVVGGQAYSADAFTARMLSTVLKRVTEIEGGPPERVALAHPAAWGPFRLDLLREAARQAGLAEVLLVPEPVAAAIANKAKVGPGALVAVYDLGGGTFDAAVVRNNGDDWEVVGTPEGAERLGGVDFDQAVIAHVDASVDGQVSALDSTEMENRVALAKLRQECQSAREALSSDTDTEIAVSLPGLSTSVRLTRDELEGMIRPRLADSLAILDRVVSSAGTDWDGVESVVLVGGCARMPMVSELVRSHTNRPVLSETSPSFAIAIGTGLAAETESNRAATPPAPPTAPSFPPPAAAVAAAAVAAPVAAAAAPPASFGEAPPVAPPATPTPTPAPAAPAAAGPSGGANRTPMIVGGVIAVLALAAGAFFLFAGGDDGDESVDAAASSDEESDQEAPTTGPQTKKGSITSAGDVFETTVTVEAGDAVGVRVTPEASFDPVFAIGGDVETLDAWADWEELELGDAEAGSTYRALAKDFEATSGTDPKGSLLAAFDNKEAGLPEEFAFVAVVDGTFRVVVAGFEDSTGDFDLEIEVEEASERGAIRALDEINDLRLVEHLSFLDSFGQDPGPLQTVEEQQAASVDEDEVFENLVATISEDLNVGPEEGRCVAEAVIAQFPITELLAAGMDDQGEIGGMSEQDQSEVTSAAGAALAGCTAG